MVPTCAFIVLMPWIVAMTAATNSMREATALVALEVEKVVMVYKKLQKILCMFFYEAELRG
jgi:hypothetical protein